MANDVDTPETTLPGADSDNNAVRMAAEGDLSWIRRVREERDARVGSETLKLGFPTWGDPEAPDLAVEYSVVPRDDLERFQKQARKNKNQKGAGTAVDIAFICNAARAVYVRHPVSGDLVKVTKDGQDVRLDKRLGEMLGLDPDENRDSKTLLMYLAKGNDVALGALAVTIAQWMANTSREVEDALVGE